jgi:hypothetical protein
MGKLDTSIVLDACDVIVFQESAAICSKNAYDPVNESCFVFICWQDRAMYSSSRVWATPEFDLRGVMPTCYHHGPTALYFLVPEISLL